MPVESTRKDYIGNSGHRHRLRGAAFGFFTAARMGSVPDHFSLLQAESKQSPTCFGIPLKGHTKKRLLRSGSFFRDGPRPRVRDSDKYVPSVHRRTPLHTARAPALAHALLP